MQKLVQGMAGLVIIALIPTVAHAHPNPITSGASFASGLLHPLFGLDHLLAMVSVGILSAQLGGRALWYVPALFVSAMLMGGMLGIAGLTLPLIEFGIAFSVFALGTSIILSKHIAPGFVILYVAIFGLCHGYAHGAEMPNTAHSWLYALGFVIATTAMHLTGIGIEVISKRIPQGTLLLRIAGAAIAGTGLHFIMSL
ncbi:MAG: HupE/UreJ family protein [Acaryochloridaceae cyanobacterium SU_2_1]|nr:HupE/UreJ family protein [Acaryochloridaceae cyanobacterium SU_2_1]NJM95722.1 HupE/UreJ family protein [Acaryochloridaceae cyanobacterium CSU_5_19]